jgi:hypothetical protein
MACGYRVFGRPRRNGARGLPRIVQPAPLTAANTPQHSVDKRSRRESLGLFTPWIQRNRCPCPRMALHPAYLVSADFAGKGSKLDLGVQDVNYYDRYQHDP